MSLDRESAAIALRGATTALQLGDDATAQALLEQVLASVVSVRSGYPVSVRFEARELAPVAPPADDHWGAL
jgi:hypothetical protein